MSDLKVYSPTMGLSGGEDQQHLFMTRTISGYGNYCLKSDYESLQQENEQLKQSINKVMQEKLDLELRVNELEEEIDQILWGKICEPS